MLFVADMASRWFIGFSSPFRGGSFMVRHRRLLLYILMPAGINIAVWAAVFGIGFSYFFGWLERLVPRGETWYWSVLFVIFSVIFGLILLLALVYLFSAVGNILAAPFNDALSRRVEEIAAGAFVEQPFSLRGMVREGRHAVMGAIKRMVLFLVVMAALLLLNLVPVVGTAANIVLGSLATLLFLAMEYVSYVMDRRFLALRARLRIVMSNVALMLGFGCGVFVLLLIPLVNFFCIPASVVGGTVLCVQRLLPGQGGAGASLESKPLASEAARLRPID